MILYRKTPALRVVRHDTPVPPFWCATMLAPYGQRRQTPLSLDWIDLRVSAAEQRVEVSVVDDVARSLGGESAIRPPALVDALGTAEEVFHRGAEILAHCAAEEGAALALVGAGDAPLREAGDLVVAAWPADPSAAETMFSTPPAERRWGVIVPIVFPLTTDLPLLASIADRAAAAGASFLASATFEMDATAKQVMARTMDLDDESYAMLFHAPLEPIAIATERHIAALADERGLADFVVPPGWSDRSNWTAAVVLMMTATRLIGMDRETELAGTIARSARVLAALDKPIARIAEAASLAIVEGLDEVSVDILSEWLERGSSAFATRVAAEWRLRRDHFGE